MYVWVPSQTAVERLCWYTSKFIVCDVGKVIDSKTNVSFLIQLFYLVSIVLNIINKENDVNWFNIPYQCAIYRAVSYIYPLTFTPLPPNFHPSICI